MNFYVCKFYDFLKHSHHIAAYCYIALSVKNVRIPSGEQKNEINIQAAVRT